MAKCSKQELQIPEWQYSCIDCGQCCRNWHVELSPDEIQRLQKLDWGDSTKLPEQRTIQISGATYIAHREDGTCIYYDPTAGNCLIHSRFNYKTKPVGCRLYPFSITPTFQGSYSLIPRFDCPAVRAKQGKHMRDRASDARAFVRELDLRGGFDELDLEGVAPAKVREVVEAIDKFVLSRKEIANIDRVIIAQTAAHRLETLGPVFINDIDLKDVLPSFFQRIVEDQKGAKNRRLGAIEQMRFISLLSSFLRRDEEVLGKGIGARLKRFTGFLKLYTSKANLHDLGQEHPDFEMSRKAFFGTPIANPDEMELKLLFQFIRIRLKAYQFFGTSTYNRSFFLGMQCLFILMPLILGLAKWRAMARDANTCIIQADDIDYAVGAIDHAYGRSELLGLSFVTILQRQISAADAHARVVEELVAPKTK